MDDLFYWGGIAAMAVLSWIVVSPRVHLGFVSTLGSSIMCLGVLGLLLQYHELGAPPHVGVDGQWLAVKLGAVLLLIGLLLQWFRRAHHAATRPPRELDAEERTRVHGRGRS